MKTSFVGMIKSAFALRWQPSRELLVVALSWVLVTVSLSAATAVGPVVAGGMLYFFLYAVLAAALFGVGIPLYWTVVVRRRPIAALGITARRLVPSLVLQVVLAVVLYVSAFSQTQLPPIEKLLPLVALSLAIGLFEAIFWRGWVQMRLEEAFGVLPGILLGALVYAAYHVGYGMPLSEIAFLFVIGIMFAVVFRITKSVFILWPLFQPLGQLVTLTKDGLNLPLIASLGFVEALALIVVLIWLANRYYTRRHQAPVQTKRASLA